MKKVEVSLEINAPIEEVWNVLIETKDYKDWNPFVVEVSSEHLIPEVGTDMEFQVCFENGSKTISKERVIEFSPPELNQGKTAEWEYRFDGFPSKIGMIKAVRTQRLEQLLCGKTLYSSAEIFRGWGTVFVPVDQVQKGFIAQADALKKKCENTIRKSQNNNK